MGIILRAVAVLQILLASGMIAFVFEVMLGKQLRLVYWGEPDLLWLPAVVLLGGILWTLARLAYPPQPRPAADTSMSPADALVAVREKAVRAARWHGMASVLRVLAVVQVAFGALSFVAICAIAFRPGVGFREHELPALWIAGMFLWGFASLGGILWAVARIAYPPQRSPAGPPVGESATEGRNDFPPQRGGGQ
jgi:hypothetical protein